MLFATLRVGFSEAAEGSAVGCKKGLLRAMVADTQRNNSDAVFQAIAMNVSVEHSSRVRIGFEGKDTTALAGPASKTESIQSDMRADIETDVTGTDAAMEEIVDERLPCFREKVAMAWIDEEGFRAVDGALETASAGRQIKSVDVERTQHPDGGVIAANSLTDTGAQALEAHE